MKEIKVQKYGFRIKTLYNNEEIITEIGNYDQMIVRSVIDLQDDGIRKALIDIGWTPPKLVPKEAKG
jgi:hypothetical protein